MRKLSLIFIMIVSVLLIASCTRGSFVVVNARESNTPTKMSMTYYKFTGHKETNVTVKEGQPIVVTFDIVTEEGTLNAYIAKNNDKSNPIYEGKDIPTSNFTVTLTEKGRYAIRLDAKAHSGRYSITW